MAEIESISKFGRISDHIGLAASAVAILLLLARFYWRFASSSISMTVFLYI
jgi:hypothetical protein